MSTFKVEIVRVTNVMKHPNADRLDVIQVNNWDWTVVTQKDTYKVGDRCVYLPIDSVLSPKLEERLFPADSKVKLKNSRIRTIKLRGAISQGMVVALDAFPEYNGFTDYGYIDGDDLSGLLGVTKYEPPTTLSPASNPAAKPKCHCNPNFKKYTGIENAKNYPKVFQVGEMVSVTLKVHGTNFRAGYVPYVANNWWRKILKFLKLTPKWQFVYGSHNVQLQDKLLYKGFYKTNVYAEAVVKYRLKEIIPEGMVVYGEIYGDGIQKGYTYGCATGERKLVVFDIIVDNAWLNRDDFENMAGILELSTTPELYNGPFDKDAILKLKETLPENIPGFVQKNQEGVVVKPLVEETCFMGRKVLKFISDNYLLKNDDNETIAH